MALMAPCAAWSQGVDDIVVTAQRRPETLAATPMSITAIDAATLKATGAMSFADFARLVPGLSYVDSGPGNKRYALRGLQSAGEPEVSLYYDEVPVSGLPGNALDTGDSQMDLKLWDTQRIEVLQGPQGTLYGNGSIGGTIRILSNRPDPAKPGAAVEVSGAGTQGGGPSLRLRAMVNVPILRDIAAIRLAAWREREGGWIDSIPRAGIALPQIAGRNINWEHTEGLRGSALVRVLPGWTVTLIGTHQHTLTGASSEVYPDYALAGDRYVSQSYVRKPWRDDATLLNLISNADLPWATLEVTGSYQDRKLARTIDTTRYLLAQFGCTDATWGHGCSGAPIVPAASYSDEFVRSWSGEARLSSRGEGALRWIAGAFIQSSQTGRDGQVARVDASGNVQFDAEHTAIGRLFARINRDGFDQQAGFANVSYAMLPALRATVGLRLAHVERSDQQTIVQQFFSGQPTGAQPFQHFSQTKLLKNAELAWRPGERTTLYLRAAEGFRAGGPNYPGGFALTAPPYQADSVWSYELGWKLRPGRAFYWDAAVFDIEWRNLQQLLPQALFSFIVNGGRARSRGFEISVTWTPLPGLTLAGNLSHVDARLVGPQPATTDPTQQLAPGDRLANVPGWTGHASVEYAHTLGPGQLSGRVDLRAEDGRVTTVATASPTFRALPGFALVDAHLAYALASRWHVSIDANNLFNRYAQLSGKALDANLVQTVTAARPRTIGMTLGWAY